MEIDLEWTGPFALGKGGKDVGEYDLDLEKLPNSPGIYIFGRVVQI